MKYIKGKITNDFKNSTKQKTFDFDLFAAHYKRDNIYKIFIDRSDDRRIVITFTEEQKNDLKNLLNNI